MKKILGSTRFTLNSFDWKDVLFTLIAVMVGAGLTYLTEVIGGLDFGNWTLLIVTGWTALVKLIKRFFTNYTT